MEAAWEGPREGALGWGSGVPVVSGALEQGAEGQVQQTPFQVPMPLAWKALLLAWLANWEEMVSCFVTFLTSLIWSPHW